MSIFGQNFRFLLLKSINTANYFKLDTGFTKFEKQSYVCEYTEPAPTPPPCVPNPNRVPLEDSEYVIRYDEPINFEAARRECRSLGKDWNLVIFNYDRELDRFTQILADHCLDDFAFWVGYYESDGNARTIYDQPVSSKKDGNTVSAKIPWADTEPNDNMGDESCVRMRAGVMNDALCSITWTAPKREGKGMGYICERHNPWESRRGGNSFAGYDGNDYKIAVPELISANDAKAACQARVVK